MLARQTFGATPIVANTTVQLYFDDACIPR